MPDSPPPKPTRKRAVERLPVADRRWLTRAEVAAAYPIGYWTLARIDRALLPFGMSGKEAVYDRQDVEKYLERLKKAAPASAEPLVVASAPRRAGRPKKAAVAPSVRGRGGRPRKRGLDRAEQGGQGEAT